MQIRCTTGTAMKRVLIYMTQLRSYRAYIVIAFQSWKLVMPLFPHFLSPSTTKGFRTGGWYGTVGLKLPLQIICRVSGANGKLFLERLTWTFAELPEDGVSVWPGRLVFFLFAQVLCLFVSCSHAPLPLCDHSPLPRTDDKLQSPDCLLGQPHGSAC